MYEPPVNFFTTGMKLVEDINKSKEAHILSAIESVGIHVDREELIKAMEYDRGQYEKGYTDGRTDAIEECIKLVGGNIKSIVGTYNKDTPLTDRASYRVAKNELIEEVVKQLEQLKEQK